jgi:tetratricopeptide (TPR) repeat protein
MDASGTVIQALRHGAQLIREDPRLAARQAREILGVAPGNADAYRLLGAALRRSGEAEEAERAELDAIAASVGDPALMRAAEALLDNDLPAAEQALRARLREKPTDVAAIRMMAELAGRLGRYPDSETLLRRALELAPAFAPARANLATVLYKQNRPAEAIAELDRLQDSDASNQNLKAAALGRIGSFEEAILIYEQVLAKVPNQPKVWMSYGHALKTVGRLDDGIAAYRRALALAPGLGEVWWSLANLKTIRFGDEDVAAMEAALGAPELAREDRYHLRFALGRAYEERGQHAESFTHYAEGNRLRGEAFAPTRSQRWSTGRSGCSPRISSPPAPGRAAPRPTRSSSSACRARARPWSSRSSPRIPRSKGRWNCPTFRRWRGGSARRARIIPTASPRSMRRRWAPSARNISSAPASSARPAALFSSTRCPTIGRMWA